jgi:hypothetical protein
MLPVGGMANAPMTAVVQPVIQHERQGQGGRPGPRAGLRYGARREIDRWQRAMRAGVVR